MAGRLSWLVLLAFIGVNLLLTFAEEDVEQDACGGTCITVTRKQFGKILLSRCKSKDKRNFTLELAAIRQLDINGSKIGRAVKNLTRQNFTFSKQLSRINYEGLDVMRLELSASHEELNASLGVTAFVACEAGNVTWGEETYSLEKGSFKFIFKVENYPFCKGTQTPLCKAGKVGEHLEFGLRIRSRGGKNAERDPDEERKRKNIKCFRKRGKPCPRFFNFGISGDELVAATQCESDGIFVNNSGDFPKMFSIDNKQLLAFRVPKFENSTRCDPGITMGTSEEDDEPDEPGVPTKPSQANSIQLSVVLFVVMVTTLFTFT